MFVPRTTPRWISPGVAIVAVLIAWFVAAPEAQAQTLTFRYVSSAGAYTPLNWPIYDEPTPAGSAAPGGSFQFQAAGSFFTLRVDDVAVPDGKTIPVFVSQWLPNGTSTWTVRCIRVRETVRHPSSAGASVYVEVFNELYWYGIYPRSCTGAARAGTAYVGL